MSKILKWEEFNESSLPSYNPYSSEHYQKEKICPDCKSTDVTFIGPSDYTRTDSGDYNRIMSYKCNKCNCVFGVNKK